MREWLLSYLRCPVSGAGLRLTDARREGDQIVAGTLSADEKHAYPIIDGIPRLLPGIKNADELRRVYADSFGHQWNTFQWERQRDEQEFFAVTDQTPQSLSGRVVLDAGCGGGRVSRVMGQYCERLIGLDYSVAVEKARRHTADLPHCEFVQGDALRPPLAPGNFDFVWSHGVLHHTPSTRAGVEALLPLVRPGGDIQVIVFLKTFLAMRFSDATLRALIRSLPYSTATRLCRAMGVLRHLPFASFWKRFVWFSQQPTAELRTYCNFDWYMPQYHHEHTYEELASWLKNAGFENIHYRNGWPDAPQNEKFAPPGFWRHFRLGQLVGVVGKKPVNANVARDARLEAPEVAASSQVTSEQKSVVARSQQSLEYATARTPHVANTAPSKSRSSRRVCVILQPGYLPWLGFFEQMWRADEFVYLDDVQYDKHGWRNRNRVKGPDGPQWLTVPVRVAGEQQPLIRDVRIDETQRRWPAQHLTCLRTLYGPTEYFRWLYPTLEDVLLNDWERIADLDIALVDALCDKLGLRRSIRRSSEMGVSAGRCERLSQICRQLDCDAYYSGAAARSYLTESTFADAGITVEFQDYRHPVYPQRYEPFVSHLSIVDLMFNCGPRSLEVLLGADGDVDERAAAHSTEFAERAT